MENSDLLKKRIERERLARKEAERILENKALELYSANELLTKLNNKKDRVLAAVSEALSYLFRQDDINVAFTKAAEILGTAEIADRVNIIIFEDSETLLDMERLHSYSNDDTKSLSTQFSKDAVKRHFIDFVEKEVSGNDDLLFFKTEKAKKSFAALAKDLEITSSLIIPVYVEDKLKSLITFDYFGEVYEWTKSDESILMAFSAAIQSAIERYEARAEIEYQRQFYENILNSIPSDLVVFNDEHKYLFINPIAVVTPEIREWMIGKDDYEYVEYRKKPKELADNRREFFNKVMESKEPFSFEEMHINKEGEEEWKLRTLNPVINEETGEVEMVIGYGLDITEIKESQRMLISAREEAENSRNMKQRFLANMSHEIRTPMNGVVGIVHLLQRTNLDEDQKKYLQILSESSEHLLHLINDILDVSKIEEGKLSITESPLQLDSIIDGVVQNLKSRIEDKNLKFESKGMDIFTVPLMGDPVRIRQIMLNLLSNAIKFTHKGKIEMHCETVYETVQEHEFIIKIKDSGIGISNEKINSIFQPFDQAERNVSTQYGGSGLGLSIVKELVDRMGGQIFVESKLDKGSTFIITLTLNKAKESDMYDDSKVEWELNENTLVGKTILVVDDHEINFIVASETIEILGADVLYAKDGQEAVSIVLEQDVDLILMDMQMPIMNGIEATQLIRLLEKPKADIPIIAMTAAALPEEREKCLQSGMNDYIAKPYNPNLLFQILSNYLVEGDQTQIKVETKTDKEKKGKKSDSGQLFDLTYLRELSGDNTKFVADMVYSFRTEMPEMIEEMLVASQNDGIDQIEKISHKASSLAGYLGCIELREILIKVESFAEKEKPIEVLGELIKDAANYFKEIDIQLNETEI